MKKKLLTILSTIGFLLAQGEAAVPFLLISPDAHSSGLGEAGVTFPETPGLAMHFNVAGIAYQRKYGDSYHNKAENPVNFSFAEWLPNLKLNDLWYLHAATTFSMDDIGDFGASLRYLNLGEVITTDDNAEQTGSYEASEFEINLAYSLEFNEDQFLGAGVKFIYSGITRSDVVVGAEKTAPGASVAVDLGYYALLGDWTDFLQDVRFGLSWNNIGPSITYKDNAQSDPLPIVLRSGLSAVLLNDEFNHLRFNYEVGILTLEQTIKKHAIGDIANRFTHSLGLEFTYDNTFIVRGGGFFESEQFGGRQFMTAGIGFNAEFVVLDMSYLIALNDERHPLDGTTRFSLRFQL